MGCCLDASPSLQVISQFKPLLFPKLPKGMVLAIFNGPFYLSQLWTMNPVLCKSYCHNQRVGRTVSAYSVCIIVGFYYVHIGCFIASLLLWPYVRKQQWEDRMTLTHVRLSILWCFSLVGGQKFYWWHSQWLYWGTTPHSLPSFCGTAFASISVARTNGQHDPTFKV